MNYVLNHATAFKYCVALHAVVQKLKLDDKAGSASKNDGGLRLC